MFDQNIDLTKDIFREVGEKVLSWSDDQTKKKIISKNENKYYADLFAHELLASKLAVIYPGVQIISEEDYKSSVERASEYWIIDPIDGTLSWVNGFRGFVSQGALIKDEKPIFSVVYAPHFERMYNAVEGYGLFINDNKFKVSAKRDELTMIDNTPKPHGITRLVYNKISATNYIESGSLGLKCCLIADRTADVFIKNVIVRDWDIAPAWLMLQETGCKISLFDGSQYLFTGNIEKNGIIVCSDEILYEKVIKIVE